MKYKIFAILSILMLASCTQDEEFNNIVDENIIGFSTYVGSSSKALEKTDFVDNDELSVHAFRHPGELHLDDVIFKPNTMNHEKLTFSDDHWNYENTVYWPINGDKISFISIYPHGLTTTFSNLNRISTPFTVNPNAADQVDFLWAGTLNREKAHGAVPFEFKHALSKITFNAVSEDIDTGTTIKITGISINDINRSAEYVLDKDLINNGSWDTYSDLSTFSPLAVGVTQEVTTTLATVGASMLLIPQDVTLTDRIVIKYIVTDKGTVGTEQTHSFTPGVAWAVNTHYIYNINIDLTFVKFHVTQNIEEWDKNPEEPNIPPSPDGTPKVIDFRHHLKGTANSYILNPTAKGGIDTRFIIPIADRINTYWSEYDILPENQIDTDTQGLRVEILWKDTKKSGVEIPDPLFITPPTNPSAKTMTKDDMAFYIDIPGGTEGNAAVAVKKADGTILWSWHLWITDYDPDVIAEANKNKIVAGKYIYTRNGENAVHRYTDCSPEDIYVGEGTINNFINGAEYPWDITTGIYHDRFIMDRNLGALSKRYVHTENDNVLLYQYGRKDPFLVNSGYLFTLGTNEIRTKQTLSYTVNNPHMFVAISSQDPWCGDATCATNSYPWHDKLLTDSFDKKSFFDPSPLGWKIPANGAFSDFIKNVEKVGTQIEYRNTITFLQEGVIQPSKDRNPSEVKTVGTVGSYWSSSPLPDDAGAYLADFTNYFDEPLAVSPSLVQPVPSTGESVRAIQQDPDEFLPR